ncbi:MAG: aminopeptidase P family protein [Eubacteriales bacterium]|nr:aminopeptidase P family protein [Eubacteriales bacterium]
MSREAIMDIFGNTGVEAILITDPHNIRYCSGFRGGEGMVYISPKQKVLITDSRYTEAAAQESDFTIIEESHKHKRVQILHELLAADQADIVGYEDHYMHCYEFSRLQNTLGEVKQWMPLEEQINRIRMIKTPEELDRIRMAESIGDKAFAGMMEILHPGMTEIEAAAELEYLLKINGGQRLSFDTIIASGKNSSMPHAIPTEKKLEAGDFVTMDFGCIYEGYCSDMTRTIVLGKASEKQREIYDLVLSAQEAALNGIHAGMTGNACDKLARDVIVNAGYGSCFGHGLGHGVGLYIHEEPRFSPTDYNIIQENMVLSVEPGIYIPGFGGVRIEDLVIVREDGIENLAHAPKHLIELD